MVRKLTAFFYCATILCSTQVKAHTEIQAGCTNSGKGECAIVNNQMTKAIGPAFTMSTLKEQKDISRTIRENYIMRSHLLNNLLKKISTYVTTAFTAQSPLDTIETDKIANQQDLLKLRKNIIQLIAPLFKDYREKQAMAFPQLKVIERFIQQPQGQSTEILPAAEAFPFTKFTQLSDSIVTQTIEKTGSILQKILEYQEKLKEYTGEIPAPILQHYLELRNAFADVQRQTDKLQYQDINLPQEKEKQDPSTFTKNIEKDVKKSSIAELKAKFESMPAEASSRTSNIKTEAKSSVQDLKKRFEN